ncbi:MAG TPA: enoyl-CoA hydratase/isomerase family protein [Candidatus Binataceae bacterium]|nr:enoyl-CoA hydratase/isomerase family protein [Candidatus Binataceae bacterium]
MEKEILFERNPPIATISLNRPRFHNALTWAMYDGLIEICASLVDDSEVRAVIMRGAGAKAFASGTDIAQFTEVRTGADGLAYEARLERAVGALEGVKQPTIAAIEGYAVGGGAALALVCDLRYGGTSAQIGVPIARTLGNCLSIANHARLLNLLGPAITKELLFRGRLATAEECHRAGVLNEIVPDGQVYARALTIAEEIANNAPLTLQVTKESVRRLQATDDQINGDDLIEKVYGSADFREGVEAFLARRKPQFRGM